MVRLQWWRDKKTKGMKIHDGCVVCGHDEETVNHILFECLQARQVWALSNVPSPQSGFGASIFENIHFLASLSLDSKIRKEIRLVPPWIIWLLWKNRNKMFENVSYSADLVVEKAYEDANHWNLAPNRALPIDEDTRKVGIKWLPPVLGCFKCNIGFSWNKAKAISVASCVLRNANGEVQFHSRRSFSQVSSNLHAKLKNWLWTLESMKSLHIEKVTFAFASKEMISALHKPREWPAIVGLLEELLAFTVGKALWDIIFEPPSCNQVVFEIARSVVADLRLPSSVASRGPRWLRELIDKEKSVIVV